MSAICLSLMTSLVMSPVCAIVISTTWFISSSPYLRFVAVAENIFLKTPFTNWCRNYYAIGEGFLSVLCACIC